MEKTKVLLVTGDGDFGVLQFIDEHGSTPIKDIIENIDNYSSADGEWNLEVLEFEGSIDSKFIKFIRNRIQDYDQSKHTNFYLETEILE